MNYRQLFSPIESLVHPVAYNIHFGKGFLLTHWKNLLMQRSSRENLCKKRYCDVPKTNRFVLKILEKLNHFVLKVRTGGFADSNLPLISSDTRFEFYRAQGLDLIFNKK